MEMEPERLSDDGYGTDHRSPTISPTKDQSEKLNLKLINKDSKEFRTKYFTEKVLNNSANGVIYQGHRITDEFPVVIKQVPRSKINKLMKIKDRYIPAEFYFHMQASECNGVVKVLNWYERRTSFVLVMEKPPNSIDLFEFSKNFGAIKEEPAKIIMKQIVHHCIDLADAAILHRDLKDENILVNTSDLSVKIIDFGCATQYHNGEYSSVAGTPEFFPPEMFKNCVYHAEKLNSWSIGILIYILVIGDVPFDTDEQIVSAKRKKYNEDHLSTECKQLLDGCLKANPADRFTIEDIIKSNWFTM